MPQISYAPTSTAAYLKGTPPDPRKKYDGKGDDNISNKKDPPRVAIRVTEYEKKKIADNAVKCGLSVSEYVRQRALGYEPESVPPDAFFVFCEKIDALMDKPFSDDVNDKARRLLAEISKQLLEPAKEGDAVWQPPDFGRSEES